MMYVAFVTFLLLRHEAVGHDVDGSVEDLEELRGLLRPVPTIGFAEGVSYHKMEVFGITLPGTDASLGAPRGMYSSEKEALLSRPLWWMKLPVDGIFRAPCQR